MSAWAFVIAYPEATSSTTSILAFLRGVKNKTTQQKAYIRTNANAASVARKKDNKPQ